MALLWQQTKVDKRICSGYTHARSGTFYPSSALYRGFFPPSVQGSTLPIVNTKQSGQKGNNNCKTNEQWTACRPDSNQMAYRAGMWQYKKCTSFWMC